MATTNIKPKFKTYYTYDKLTHTRLVAYKVLSFDYYYVKKESDNFYGVYNETGTLITSGTSFGNACKKAKLLQIGYDTRRDLENDYY